MQHFYKEKTNILINSRFVLQFNEARNTHEVKAETTEVKFEAPKTIDECNDYSDKCVAKAEQDGGITLENSKYGDTVPNPEFLTDAKKAKLIKEKPQMALLNPSEFINNPELLQAAARSAVDKCPSVLLSPLIPKNLPNYPKLRGEALQKLAVTDPRRVIEEPVQPGDSPQTRALAQANLSRFNHYA